MNKTEIYKFKDLDNKPVYLFLFGSVLKDSTKDEMNEILLDGSTYEVLIKYESIGKYS